MPPWPSSSNHHYGLSSAISCSPQPLMELSRLCLLKYIHVYFIFTCTELSVYTVVLSRCPKSQFLGTLSSEVCNGCTFFAQKIFFHEFRCFFFVNFGDGLYICATINVAWRLLMGDEFFSTSRTKTDIATSHQQHAITLRDRTSNYENCMAGKAHPNIHDAVTQSQLEQAATEANLSRTHR